METTYRLVSLTDRTVVGGTAATPELAKLIPGEITTARCWRVGMERTDWIDNYGKLKVHRTVLVDAETQAGDWDLND